MLQAELLQSMNSSYACLCTMSEGLAGRCLASTSCTERTRLHIVDAALRSLLWLHAPDSAPLSQLHCPLHHLRSGCHWVTRHVHLMLPPLAPRAVQAKQALQPWTHTWSSISAPLLRRDLPLPCVAAPGGLGAGGSPALATGAGCSFPNPFPAACTIIDLHSTGSSLPPVLHTAESATPQTA